jgi:hypothetical protein
MYILTRQFRVMFVIVTVAWSTLIGQSKWALAQGSSASQKFVSLARVDGSIGPEVKDGAPFCLDGTAFCTDVGEALRVWDARTGRPRGKPLPQKGLSKWCLSRDGSIAFTASENEIRIWNVADSSLVVTVAEKALSVLAISPNADRFATVAGDHTWTLHVWRVTQGKVQPLSRRTFLKVIDSMSFDPSGQSILVRQLGGPFVVMDASTGESRGEAIDSDYHGLDSISCSGLFSPDGRRIVIPQTRGWKLVEVGTGKVISSGQLDDDSSRPVQFDFSADGSRVSVSNLDSDLEWGRIYVFQLDKPDSPIKLGRGLSCQIALSGAALYHRDGEAVLWDLPDGLSIQTFRTNGSASLSRDGQHILLEPVRGVTSLWQRFQVPPDTKR